MLKSLNKENRTELSDYLAARAYEISPDMLIKTSGIIEQVRSGKDQALKELTEKYDHVTIDNPVVSTDELYAQAAKADPAFVQDLIEAASNILAYHQTQVIEPKRLDKEDGVYMGWRVIPLDSVGIYVPGGRAQYPSSVLMNAIPAKVAGVRRIVMTTPPNTEGKIPPNLAAAAIVAGVDEVIKAGGAQAVAALAYGTETIEPVDKITGPGNIFVAAAKKLVFGKVDIDMIAGPSEILVIADENANPAHVAADLLSQAEHDPMASSILLSTSQSVIDAVNAELEKQTAVLPKREIVEQSLAAFGTSVLCDSIEEAIEISNEIAPEHLELQIADPYSKLDLVTSAGSVFLGYTTCESIGDYFGGTNHVLPTSRTARFSSALGVDAFTKKSSYMYYSPEALRKHGQKITRMAQEEELEAHANAVRIRLNSMAADPFGTEQKNKAEEAAEKSLKGEA
ncbi:histidinol dehydrogenase [Allobaculum mucilyticum]|uniref:histidinol dehydrogenase n=1 Tax=Allobaculum mucilyticum TaxID=2834459 RepID=UPI001E2A8C56|nr:histidinol dehydrogenase [Allobaculum mucilyticum]